MNNVTAFYATLNEDDEYEMLFFDKQEALLYCNKNEEPTPVFMFDVEHMIRTCIPGGDSCDPQLVADAIRDYFGEENA